MELRQLQTLISIQKAGSFSRAAEQLGYTQPTLTAHIQSLERELQVKLFDRLGHQVHLTHDGTVFIAYAEQILKLVEEAQGAVSKEDQQGKIIIGVSETFSVVRLPALLKEFRRRYPSIQIELQFGDAAKFQGDLIHNVIDLAVILNEKIENTYVYSELLCPEPMSLVSSADHSLAGGPKIVSSKFENENVIVTQEGCAYRLYIENLLKNQEIQPRSLMKVKNIEAIKQFVMSGMGLAILPQIYVEKEISEQLLAELSWSGDNLDLYTQMVYHKDKFLTASMLQFLAFTREWFQKQPNQ